MISFPTWIRRRRAAVPADAQEPSPKPFDLGSFSLRARLVGGFAGVLALTAAVSAVSFVFQEITLRSFYEVTQVDAKAADLAANSSVAMLVARRNEKDFLLRYKDYGLQEAK